MVGHVLCGFERAVILEEYSDSCSPKRVIADSLGQACSEETFFHHPQHVAPGDGFTGQAMRLAQTLKHPRTGIGDGRRVQPGVEILLGLVMQPDELFLVALFEQPQAGTLSLQTVI